MERAEAHEFIRERTSRNYGLSRGEVVSELMDSANVSRATAYRWFNEVAQREKDPDHTDLVLNALKDQLYQAQAIDDPALVLKVAKEYAAALAKFKRV